MRKLRKLRRLQCWFDTVWGTVTMPEFWWALITGTPPVVFSGHLVELNQWEDPVYDPKEGAIQYAIEDCVRCGQRRRSGWKRWYGQRPPLDRQSS